MVLKESHVSIPALNEVLKEARVHTVSLINVSFEAPNEPSFMPGGIYMTNEAICKYSFAIFIV